MKFIEIEIHNMDSLHKSELTFSVNTSMTSKIILTDKSVSNVRSLGEFEVRTHNYEFSISPNR